MASGSSLPGGLTVSNLIMVWSLEMVSALALSQSGLKQTLDLSHQRGEGETVSTGARRDLVSVLALALGEQLARHPRTRAGVSEPVDVELRGQLFVQHGLQLPRAKISRRIEARIDIHECIRRLILEIGGVPQQ